MGMDETYVYWMIFDKPMYIHKASKITYYEQNIPQNKRQTDLIPNDKIYKYLLSSSSKYKKITS